MPELLKCLEAMRTLKTGTPSVSDPVLGVTESPLGDATMLPVLALKDLEYLNMPVANWVGMNPTNAGFQLLQEAYQEGKWFGGKPQFKIPKAYRKAGYKGLSAEDAAKGPSIRGKGKRQSKDKEHVNGVRIASNSPEDDSNPGHQFDRPTFQLTRGPDFDEFTWTMPINEELIKQVKEEEEGCHNGWEGKIERELAKEFRDFGLDVGLDISSDEESTDSDSTLSDQSSSSDGKGHGVHREPRSCYSSAIPVKRTKASSSLETAITAKKAKLWLESL
jgi:hypothetical protein